MCVQKNRRRSVGCILCELIGRKALFTGKDHLDQIRKIVDILGYPAEEEVHASRVCSVS